MLKNCRDRESHLRILLSFLHPILQRQQIKYKIFVIEQVIRANNFLLYLHPPFRKNTRVHAILLWVLQNSPMTFNKGSLFNAGIKEIRKLETFDCFVFQDVDMIPEDDRNLYTCDFAPLHLGAFVNKFKYQQVKFL